MSEHVYEHIDVTGSSNVSADDAVRTAINRTVQSIRGMKWFEVTDTRGQISYDDVKYWQVTLRIGFTIED
jgi:flavin-binding protein dodecin